MSLLAAATAVQAGASVVSGGLKLIGSAQQLRAQKQITRGLKKANSEYVTDLISMSEKLNERPELKFDDSAIQEQVSRARRAQITAGGRSIGEEARRDSVRQSTADSVARARGTGGSTADLLSFASAAKADEMRAMSGIDAEAASLRERSLFAAEDRLNAALAREQEFNRWRDQSINQDRLAAFNQELEMQGTIADARYNARTSNLAQRGALANSKAAMWGAVGDVAGSVVSGVGNLMEVQDQINRKAKG